MSDIRASVTAHVTQMLVQRAGQVCPQLRSSRNTEREPRVPYVPLERVAHDGARVMSRRTRRGTWPRKGDITYPRRVTAFQVQCHVQKVATEPSNFPVSPANSHIMKCPIFLAHCPL